MGNRTFDDSLRGELLERLAAGEFLSSIARDERMPDVSTIKRWAAGSDSFAEEIRIARETGFEVEAERLVEFVENCDDPQKARAVSEARRWRIGKLSQVFRDRPLVGVAVNVDAGDHTFDAVAGVLEAASARLSSGRESTYIVDESGTARPIGARDRLPNLASDGGARLRENPDG
jgi:hypothetical protein